MSFYDAIAQNYDHIFPLQHARTDFVEQQLEERPEEIVDLGCATGSLGCALAQAGWSVLGLDLNSTMVAIAQGRAAAQQLSARFIVEDMRAIQARCAAHSLAGVLCFGNTLVHLTSSTEIAALCAKVHGLLVPGGSFIGQIVNYDRILSQRPPGLPTIDNERVCFERNYHYDRGNGLIGFAARLTDKRTGTTSNAEVTLYPLTNGELQASLSAAGFTQFTFFADYRGTPWHEGAGPLIFRARTNPT